METNEYLEHAPEGFEWPRCPQAAGFIEQRLVEFLDAHGFAGALARRMGPETSTRFFDWVDHLLLPAAPAAAEELERKFGFVPEAAADAPRGQLPLWHPHAQLPRIVLSEEVRAASAAIHVDEVSAFQTAHGLVRPVAGAPLSAYRRICLEEGDRTLVVVERRGTRGYVYQSTAGYGCHPDGDE